MSEITWRKLSLILNLELTNSNEWKDLHSEVQHSEMSQTMVILNLRLRLNREGNQVFGHVVAPKLSGLSAFYEVKL